MSKTVTLRLKEDTYLKFQKLAKQDNRPLSNLLKLQHLDSSMIQNISIVLK